MRIDQTLEKWARCCKVEHKGNLILTFLAVTFAVTLFTPGAPKFVQARTLLGNDVNMSKLGTVYPIDGNDDSSQNSDYGTSINPCSLPTNKRSSMQSSVVLDNRIEANRGFTFYNKRLCVFTPLMELAIEGGAIVYLRDKASGEVLVNSSPYANRTANGQNLVGFASMDLDSNEYPRWPEQLSSVTFERVDIIKGRLIYYPLYNHNSPTDSQLIIDIVIVPESGEVILELIGIEGQTNLTPFSIELPIINIESPAIILGSGAEYMRAEPEANDQTSYPEMGLYSPAVAVVQGTKSTLAVWSETALFAPDYVRLEHKPDYDHLILHTSQDPKQIDRQIIISSHWRIGTYSSWPRAAKRWREKFEERTGARPLWESRTLWVRNIHAVFDGTNQNYSAHLTKYSELASKADPGKVLFFIWNADRIAFYGDHTLVDKITRPTPEELEQIEKYGWTLLLYHPYNLIYSEKGVAERLQFLTENNWLPAGYKFSPDYAGTPENWQNYWSDIKTEYFDGSILYILHPGSSKFKDYFVHNYTNYCRLYQAKGAYLDLSGDDNSFLFPENLKIVENQDYVMGEQNTIARVSREFPSLGLMTEYQSTWVLPYSFYSWEGSTTHLKQNPFALTRLNHPLRVALIGSYSWARESNQEYVDDIAAALLGTLPEVSLLGDYNVSDERALWSQYRAKLFTSEELFNDVPDQWEPDAIAYYRSKNGNWFIFKRIGSTYGYVEKLPDGAEVIRLQK